MATLADILETKGREVYRVEETATVYDAVAAMCKQRVGALLVGDAANPAGIFSERDVMTRVIMAGRDPRTTFVRDVMSRELAYVELHAAPEVAMRIMTEHRCRHLPVVVDGKVAGVVSIGDLVRWVSRHQEIELQWLNDYLAGRYPG